MGDDRRLKNLVERGRLRKGWSPSTGKTLYYVARILMAHLGGYDAFCFAATGDVESWLGSKGAKTAYAYLRHVRTVYGFLVDEGVIDDNPTAGLRVGAPTRADVHLRPSADVEDLKAVLAQAKRSSGTIEGARNYLILCLRVRCGVGYSAMARCRIGDLELAEGGGCLLPPPASSFSGRQVLYRIDPHTAWACTNYLDLRGTAAREDPLVAKGSDKGGGFCQYQTLSCCVKTLFAECGLRAGDYDLDKTMMELAYAEGANVLQASTLVQGSVSLAMLAAEELPSADPYEIYRRLHQNLDPDEIVATGLVRPEDIMAVVLPAYGAPYVKVIIGPDGWAKFEIPGEGA